MAVTFTISALSRLNRPDGTLRAVKITFTAAEASGPTVSVTEITEKPFVPGVTSPVNYIRSLARDRGVKKKLLELLRRSAPDVEVPLTPPPGPIDLGP